MTYSDPISGIWTAIATPFLKTGEIDWQGFEALLETQRTAGIDGVVVSGTTGEAPTLSIQEKLSLVRKARAILPECIRIMAGTGNNNTGQSVELSKLAVDAGADSLLIVTPPYNKPNLEGLKTHFSMIANAISAPICLYHVPGRTALSLSADEMASICKIDSVQAIKEASGDISLLNSTVNSSKVPVLSGDDPTFLASLAVGSHGVISVITNIFPEEFIRLRSFFLQGDHQKALKIHNALLPVIDMMFCEPNPAPLKAALHIRGICADYLRPPLVSVTKENYLKIEKIMDQAQTELKDILT
tara:strand:- start:246 stop:1148 length:903 start_codon:yes stop_codon:yes gene_type:complete